MKPSNFPGSRPNRRETPTQLNGIPKPEPFDLNSQREELADDLAALVVQLHRRLGAGAKATQTDADEVSDVDHG